MDIGGPAEPTGEGSGRGGSSAPSSAEAAIRAWPPVPAGVVWKANSCYLAAVLQILLVQGTFCEQLLSQPMEPLQIMDIAEPSVTLALREVISTALQYEPADSHNASRSPTVKLKALRHALHQFYPETGYKEEQATTQCTNECLHHLIEAMHSEAVALGSGNEHDGNKGPHASAADAWKARSRSPLYDLFQFVTRLSTACHICSDKGLPPVVEFVIQKQWRPGPGDHTTGCLLDIKLSEATHIEEYECNRCAAAGLKGRPTATHVSSVVPEYGGHMLAVLLSRRERAPGVTDASSSGSPPNNRPQWWYPPSLNWGNPADRWPAGPLVGATYFWAARTHYTSATRWRDGTVYYQDDVSVTQQSQDLAALHRNQCQMLTYAHGSWKVKNEEAWARLAAARGALRTNTHTEDAVNNAEETPADPPWQEDNLTLPEQDGIEREPSIGSEGTNGDRDESSSDAYGSKGSSGDESEDTEGNDTDRTTKGAAAQERLRQSLVDFGFTSEVAREAELSTRTSRRGNERDQLSSCIAWLEGHQRTGDTVGEDPNPVNEAQHGEGTGIHEVAAAATAVNEYDRRYESAEITIDAEPPPQDVMLAKFLSQGGFQGPQRTSPEGNNCALNATSRHSVPNPRGEWQLNDRLAAQARHILSTAVGTTTREWQLSSLQATLPNCYNNCTGRRDQPKSTEVDEESDDSESVTEAPRPEKLKVLPPRSVRKWLVQKYQRSFAEEGRMLEVLDFLELLGTLHAEARSNMGLKVPMLLVRPKKYVGAPAVVDACFDMYISVEGGGSQEVDAAEVATLLRSGDIRSVIEYDEAAKHCRKCPAITVHDIAAALITGPEGPPAAADDASAVQATDQKYGAAGGAETGAEQRDQADGHAVGLGQSKTDKVEAAVKPKRKREDLTGGAERAEESHSITGGNVGAEV